MKCYATSFPVHLSISVLSTSGMSGIYVSCVNMNLYSEGLAKYTMYKNLSFKPFASLKRHCIITA